MLFKLKSAHINQKKRGLYVNQKKIGAACLQHFRSAILSSFSPLLHRFLVHRELSCYLIPCQTQDCLYIKIAWTVYEVEDDLQYLTVHNFSSRLWRGFTKIDCAGKLTLIKP